MKKHWKKIILVLGIIFLSVAGYLVYIFQFKEYETADENVDKVIEEEYEVELPDGSVIILDKDGNVVEDKDGSAEGKTAAEGSASEGGASADGTVDADGTASADGTTTGSTEGSTSSSSNGTTGGSATTTSDTASSSSGSVDKATGSTGSSPSASGGSGTKAGSGSSGNGSSGSGSGNGSNNGGSAGSGEAGATVASIKQKYEPTLADIEGQASSRISGLIGAAQSEYAQKKANGESINYAYFYNKYVNAATELENRTDTVFYAVIGTLKKELKTNGLAESHAESFVSEYEARKQARKKELLSKASGM